MFTFWPPFIIHNDSFNIETVRNFENQAQIHLLNAALTVFMHQVSPVAAMMQYHQLVYNWCVMRQTRTSVVIASET